MARIVSASATSSGPTAVGSILLGSAAKRAMRSACSSRLDRSLPPRGMGTSANLTLRSAGVADRVDIRSTAALPGKTAPDCRNKALTATPAVTRKNVNSATRACPGVIILTPTLTLPHGHYSKRFVNDLLTDVLNQYLAAPPPARPKRQGPCRRWLHRWLQSGLAG